jgi:hypothetical protein
MIPVHSLAADLLADVLRRQPLSPAKVAFAWRTARMIHCASAAFVSPPGHWGRSGGRPP